MKSTVLTIALLAALSMPSYAGWHLSDGAGGPMVVNGKRGEPGTTHIKVPSDKAGKKLAKKLNKIEKKDAKGVVAEGCPDLPGVVC